MKKIGTSKKLFRPVSVTKIRRKSISSSIQQTSQTNFQSSILPINNQTRQGSLTFSSIESTILTDNHPTESINSFKKEEENNDLIKNNILTPINKTKINRIKRNSVDISNENPQRNKSSIMFVKRKLSSRLERLHGEDFTPLNNDQHSTNSQLTTDPFKTTSSSTNIYQIQQDYQQTKNNRRSE